MSNIAIIRIKGPVRQSSEVEYTMNMLHLKKKHNCVILGSSPSLMGMIKKVEHLVAWGEINAETAKLLEKRKKGNIFALQPPKGGFARKGIKLPFKLKGSYGNYGEKINDLIKRML